MVPTHNRASLHSVVEFMHESIVFCSTCTMSSYRKFTFALLSPDDFLVYTNGTAVDVYLSNIYYRFVR